jgi:hypothetical protein
MFYDIKSIFNHWKIYCNTYVVSVIKCVNILEELTKTVPFNNKLDVKKYYYLINEHDRLNKEYFKVAHAKTRKKYELIKLFNENLVIVEYKQKELLIRDKKRKCV